MLLIEVLTQGYRLARVLKRAGRGLSGSEQDEALHFCNSLLDGLKTERCFIYQMIRTEFAVIQNQQDYIVGSAAYLAQYGITPDWDIEKPERLYGAGFLVPTSGSVPPSEVPMYVITDYSEWKNIITKQTTASQARVIYYRPGLQSNNPIAGTASLWPLPYQNSTLVLYTPGLVSEFDSVDQDVFWPQGYREALEYLFAECVAERYGVTLVPSVTRKAKEYKARVMANQLTPIFLRSDSGACGRPDSIAAGWWSARTWPGGWA